jgi:hypothetical protein
MKVGKWWVSPGVLTSGTDPGVELAAAADQFGDEYTPMLFMTGDGHAHPSFGWTMRGHWPAFFREVVAINKVCCHVEQFANTVTAAAVPAVLADVYRNGKVFGWEPEVFKTIQRVLEAVNEMLADVLTGIAPNRGDINYLTKDMWAVHGQGQLRAEGVQAMQYWDIARAQNSDPVPLSALPNFGTFLRNYQRAAMQLRTGIHPVIARHLQGLIDRYPDHMHLISCGDAHLIYNALHGYLTPPPGTFGVADQLK